MELPLLLDHSDIVQVPVIITDKCINFKKHSKV